MVAPVLLGAGAAAEAHDHGPREVLSLGLAGTALATVLHVTAMLVVMAAVAVLVYDRLGVAVLRTAWLNTEHVWAGAFVLAGVVTLFT
jgi:hypothetical protein